MVRPRTSNLWVEILFIVVVVGSVTASGKVIYVDANAPEADDGTNWENAYNFLQDALADANSSEKPVEIRVAQGVYAPDSNSAVPDGTGDPNATFQLINCVTLKGGYAGFDDPDPNAQDIELYETILTGDLDDNDVDVNDPYDLLTEPTRADNAYHVVTGNGTDPNAILDCFTITAGSANGYHLDVKVNGGGMFNYPGSPTVTNCTFSENFARNLGGGMFNSNGSSPIITDCVFTNNTAMNNGGGMSNNSSTGEKPSSPTLTNCAFTANFANSGGAMDYWLSGSMVTNCTFINNMACYRGGALWGAADELLLTNCTFINNVAEPRVGTGSASAGAMCNIGGDLVFVDCTFLGNRAGSGGALVSSSANLTLTNCAFSGNLASSSGGAIYNLGGSDTDLLVTNCIFKKNSAGEMGGGILNFTSETTLVRNSTFAGNSAALGGGMLTGATSTVVNCTFTGNSAVAGGAMAVGGYPTLNECILWANEARYGREVALLSTSTMNITYSNVEGGPASVYVEDVNSILSWGVGNTDTDPCFADPGYWDPNGTPADASDDFWVDGDYHPKSQAGRWNPNTEAWVTDDVTSPCIDAGDPMSPIIYEPFSNGGVINMGAYGGTIEASKSYFGKPPCETIVAGDVNGDCIIDFRDFCIMALHWCEDNNP